MDKDIDILVKLVEKRILIDIAYSGCGSGCKYCYIESPSSVQKVVDKNTIHQICDWIISNGFQNHIITLCPNTEPFKSQESTKLIMLLIERLSRHSTIFQISTKEHLNHKILCCLNELCVTEKQIFLNISMPTIKSSTNLEPFAASISERKKTINNIHSYKNLTSCLYIKPFLDNTAFEVLDYIALIQECVPDYVCVGVNYSEFDILGKSTCISLYKEDLAGKLLNDESTSKLLAFSKEIQDATSYLVTHSTMCHIVDEFNLKCHLNLKQYNKAFCSNCNLGKTQAGMQLYGTLALL